MDLPKKIYAKQRLPKEEKGAPTFLKIDIELPYGVSSAIVKLAKQKKTSGDKVIQPALADHRLSLNAIVTSALIDHLVKNGVTVHLGNDSAIRPPPKSKNGGRGSVRRKLTEEEWRKVGVI